MPFVEIKAEKGQNTGRAARLFVVRKGDKHSKSTIYLRVLKSVMEKGEFKLGDRVRILRGVSEHAGLMALTPSPTGLQLGQHGNSLYLCWSRKDEWEKFIPVECKTTECPVFEVKPGQVVLRFPSVFKLPPDEGKGGKKS
jgi:hypothetical protein